MSYESDNRIDADYNESPFVRECHKTAGAILGKAAIDPKRFIYPSGDYSRENVEADLKKIEEYKENFEVKHLAEVLEAIFYEHIEMSEWLGRSAETIKTSEFDDIMNGVDLVVEFNQEAEAQNHLALGVDVTFGARHLESKFNKIKAEIDADTLAEVKYYDSATIHGRLKQVPRVVVGVEKETVLELAQLWMQHKNQELAQHEVQFVLLGQIRKQLNAFMEYAQKNGKANSERAYARSLTTVRRIIEEKRDQRPKALSHLDQVYTGIQEQLARFK